MRSHSILDLVHQSRPVQMRVDRPGLLGRASAKEHIPGGFRGRFEPQSDWVKEAAAVIDAEHRCCRFLRFLLLAEPDDGPVWLEVTGPEGTEDFLSTLLNTTPSGSPAGK